MESSALCGVILMCGAFACCHFANYLAELARYLAVTLRILLRSPAGITPDSICAAAELFGLWADDKNRQLRLVGFRLGV